MNYIVNESLGWVEEGIFDLNAMFLIYSMLWMAL